ncbi:MAG: 16S rRNA (adenine(1518)-N(6)/adenine(1519)-N(6))-dimethyltransferase RsmA [Candidatus Protistobacter heckmanni]|nr:16S rRNA (adenine(1518)-N(6)/adenine(1519)-N(6))-dimethyltransferase RsmA [Candidatus Protistobacter heckmanni]
MKSQPAKGRGQSRMQGHEARKRFGQNFLHDAGVVGAIVNAVNPEPGECVVEIGPGLGALTGPLIERCGAIHAVELDRDLIARLSSRFGKALTMHEGDALQFDFAQIAAGEAVQGQRLRVVGNLPYNISSPLLFHLLEAADKIQDQHFMLQKEVVERMIAEPGSKAYGRLSVMLQLRYHMEMLFVVPPESFDPQPRVDSAVVRILPWPDTRRVDLGCDMQTLQDIVALAFSQRRKMLRNTLGDLPLDFAAIGFDLSRRAEEVPPAEYVALARLA